ncbi:TIGR01777 family oxidoreductase [Hydrocarboniphaga sp.]|uniref:TIGR01777 family oxidoreductase n=1 Tax=Hydrocarboniphaga sp. TaxID=2033016 RepID=UPI003D13F39E
MNTASRTILITGATGFIAGALIPQLLARGDQVVALARNLDKARKKLGAGVEIVGSLDAIAPDREIDAVINLAGEPLAAGPWNAARKQRLIDSRVQTTAALIALMSRLQKKPSVMISGSAVGYYGDRGDATLDEHDAATAEFMSELCVLWENAAQPAADLGVRLCLLRTGLVFGHNGGLLPPLLLTSRFGLGAVLGDGRQWQPWIHLDDEVGVILHLLDHPTMRGPFNAVAPEPVTQRALMRAIAAQMHRPLWLRVPAGLLKLAGEMSALFLISQRVLPVGLLEAGYTFRHPELSGALKAIIAK